MTDGAVQFIYAHWQLILMVVWAYLLPLATGIYTFRRLAAGHMRSGTLFMLAAFFAVPAAVFWMYGGPTRYFLAGCVIYVLVWIAMCRGTFSAMHHPISAPVAPSNGKH